MLNCKFCQKRLKNKIALSQHENKCFKNPDKLMPFSKVNGDIKNGKIKHWSKGQTKENNLSLANASMKLKQRYKTGEIKKSGCVIWSKEKRSEHAKNTNFGGYRPNAGRSKKYKVIDSFNNEQCLQSSYEYRFFQLLNFYDVKWLRPKHLKYDDKKYFADFYLPEFDIYVDTKNDYLIKLDREKIEKVIEQNLVRLEVLSENDLTELENTR